MKILIFIKKSGRKMIFLKISKNSIENFRNNKNVNRNFNWNFWNFEKFRRNFSKIMIENFDFQKIFFRPEYFYENHCKTECMKWYFQGTVWRLIILCTINSEDLDSIWFLCLCTFVHAQCAWKTAVSACFNTFMHLTEQQ